jgi:hypothetical protein
MDAATDAEPEDLRVAGHLVVDDERDAWVGRDVAELLAGAEAGPADVDGPAGVVPVADRNDLWRAVGTDGGEAARALDGEVLALGVGERQGLPLCVQGRHATT